MSAVLGVDGARGSWVGAIVDGDRVKWLVLPDIDAALAVDADAIGVDMPIGLPATGRRECDLLAKQVLGRAHPRVFLTPPRGVLDARSYAEARPLHRELTGGLGMSAQTWGLMARVREVDARADDPRLVEVHPELSFALLAGRVLAPKRTSEGRDERIRALRAWLPDLGDVPDGDDGLDALAAAWSAARWLAGTAHTLPAGPPHDERSRPMRIVT
jgi:predicted RNase H-like nuclease